MILFKCSITSAESEKYSICKITLSKYFLHANQSVQKKKVPLDFECFDTSSYSITKGSPISKEFESKLNVSSFKSFSSDLDTFSSFGLTISDVCCNLSKKSEPKNGFHSNNIFIINAIS